MARPMRDQCGETTSLQEIATTMTRIATLLRVSAIAGVKVEYLNSDEHRAPGAICSIRQGHLSLIPTLIAEGNIV